MTVATTVFKPEDYLRTPEAIAEYLTSAFETGDVSIIADALGIAARARGMSSLSEETGLSRQSLYRSLSPGGKPELATILKVIKALGVRLVPTLA